MTVSGIIGGKALKGPADRMLVSIGHEASAARRRRDCCAVHDTFVLDAVDASARAGIAALGLRTHVTDTIMADASGRARLASDLLALASAQVPT